MAINWNPDTAVHVKGVRCLLQKCRSDDVYVWLNGYEMWVYCRTCKFRLKTPINMEVKQ